MVSTKLRTVTAAGAKRRKSYLAGTFISLSQKITPFRAVDVVL